MTGRVLHRSAYDILMGYREAHPDFKFWLRQRKEEKFRAGLIFQGNEGYAFAGLYNRSGGTNMTRSIGLVFVSNGDDTFHIKLENAFNEESDSHVLSFYERMRELVGGFEHMGKANFQKFFNQDG